MINLMYRLVGQNINISLFNLFPYTKSLFFIKLEQFLCVDIEGYKLLLCGGSLLKAISKKYILSTNISNLKLSFFHNFILS